MLIDTSVHTVKFNNSVPDEVVKVKFNHQVVWVRELELVLVNNARVKDLTDYIKAHNPNNVPRVKVTVPAHTRVHGFKTGPLAGLDVTLEVEAKSGIYANRSGGIGLHITGPINLQNKGRIYGGGGKGGRGGQGSDGLKGQDGADTVEVTKEVTEGPLYTWRGNSVNPTGKANMNYTYGKWGSITAAMGGPGWEAAIGFNNSNKWWSFKLKGPCGEQISIGVDPHGKICYFPTICGVKGWIKLKTDRHFIFHISGGSWQKTKTVVVTPATVGGIGGVGGWGGEGGEGGEGGYHRHVHKPGKAGEIGDMGGDGKDSTPTGGNKGDIGETGYDGGFGGMGGALGRDGSPGKPGEGPNGQPGQPGKAAGPAIEGKHFLKPGSVTGTVSGKII